jgi:hypothetical protein
VVGHHVRRDDLVELAGALEMDVPPEVEQHRPVQRLGRAIQQLRRRDHAVVDGLLEPVHRSSRLRQPGLTGTPPAWRRQEASARAALNVSASRGFRNWLAFAAVREHASS